MGWMSLGKRRKANRKLEEKAVGKERAERRVEKNRTVAVGIVATLIILGFLYFFVIAPTFAMKPSLTKLALASPSDIGSGHINWMLNEVGAYKLHPYLLFGERPVIESAITDQNRKFTTTVTDNYPTTAGSPANNP